MLCENCLHNDVCGEEGYLDEALTFCKSFISSTATCIYIKSRINSEVIPKLADRINESLPNIVNTELKCGNCYYYTNYPYTSILKWIEDVPGIYRCPNCGHTAAKQRNFCCDCGSKFWTKELTNNVGNV